MNRLYLAALLALGTLLSPAARAAKAPEEPTLNLRRTVTVEVVRKTKDAVVNISTTKLVAQRVNPWGFDPWQVDPGQVVRVPANSLGSGFIVHPDGYVITNHHVIDRARKAQVELADGRKLDAELISSDPDADLAVLKINAASDPKSPPKPFPFLELGDSSDLLIGEPVIAVGNPLGFSHSVSTGIVSAIHRDLKDQQDRVLLGDLIQTDAAINPGNSGGPLLNAYGQVIGINTAIRGDAQNIGFAIPINRLRDLIPELMNPLQVNKIDLALHLQERRRLGPPAKVECEIVVAGEEGKVVKTINGKRPANIIDAQAILLRARTDQRSVSVQFADGSRKEFALRPLSTILEARKLLGLGVEPVTPMLAEKYSLASEDGLLITEVARGSVSAQAGLKPGDIIVQLGRSRISKLDDLAASLHRLPEKGRLRVGVVRGDRIGAGYLEF